MHKTIWRGSEVISMGKSLPPAMLLRSVETRFVIIPTRLDPLSIFFFSSSPLCFFPFLVLSPSIEDGADLMSNVKVVVSFVPPTGWLTVMLSETEAESEVKGSVGRRLADEGSAVPDFIRMRRACSNTSWMTMAWVRLRSRICTSRQGCYNRRIHRGTNREEEVAVPRFRVSSIIRH